MVIFPISVIFGPAGSPIFVVVGLSHIHAVLYPFFFFPAVNHAPLVLGPGIRARGNLPDILKFPCRQAGRVSRICVRILGRTYSRVGRALLVLGTLLIQGHIQSNQNIVVVRALLVPIASRLVVCVQVYHIGYEDDGVEG